MQRTRVLLIIINQSAWPQGFLFLSVKSEEEGTANLSDSEDDDVSHPPPVHTSTEARSAASLLLSYFQAKCKDE